MYTENNREFQNHSGKLTMDEYTQACSLSQIISIDLLVRNKEGKYLLGMRKNPPARDFYFVPGSRVFKGEFLKNSFHRISQDELGCKPLYFKLHGIYEHFYENDSPSSKNIDTHYVVFAYDCELPDDFNEEQFLNQHSECVWMDKKEILSNNKVHLFTKYYFTPYSPNRLDL